MGDEQQPSIPDNAPWWAKSIGFVGKTFGISALILGFYMGQSAGLIPNPTVDELQEIKGHIVQSNAVNQEIIKALKEQNQQRQMRCVIKAKTDDEKKACFPSKRDED